MKFKYDGIATLTEDTMHVNVVQKTNPFLDKSIDSLEDANVWVRQYLSNNFNAQPIFFELEIYENENIVESDLLVNKDYKLKLVESTGRLVGKYNMLLTSNNRSSLITFSFIDGEAETIIDFNETGVYELDINCEFLIGQERFFALVDISEKVISALHNKNKSDMILIVK